MEIRAKVVVDPFAACLQENRERIEIITKYGFDTTQAILLLISMNLENLSESLVGYDGSSVSEQIGSIADTLEECRVRNGNSSALAITGTIDTV